MCDRPTREFSRKNFRCVRKLFRWTLLKAPVAASSLGGVPQEQKMLKGHLPRVIYHLVCSNIRRKTEEANLLRVELDPVEIEGAPRQGRRTTLKLTLWLRGTNPSTSAQKRAPLHQIGESTSAFERTQLCGQKEDNLVRVELGPVEIEGAPR